MSLTAEGPSPKDDTIEVAPHAPPLTELLAPPSQHCTMLGKCLAGFILWLALCCCMA